MVILALLNISKLKKQDTLPKPYFDVVIALIHCMIQIQYLS